MKKSISKAIVSVFLALILVFSEAIVLPTDAKAATVSLNYTDVLLGVGQTLTLKVTGSSATKFATSKKSVATVSSKGKIKGVKAGTAKITVTCKNKKSYVCNVTVVEKKVASKVLLANETFADQDKVVSTDYSYQTNAKLAQKKTTESVKYNKNLIVPASEEVYTYKKDGETVALYEVYSEGKLLASYDYDNGTYFSITEGEIVNKEYDDNNNLVKESYFDDDDELPYLVKTYNKNGKLTSEETFNVSYDGKKDTYSSVAVGKTEYTYAKDGSLSKSVYTLYEKDGKTVASATEEKYDASGEAYSSIETKGSGKKIVSGWEQEVTLDSNNRRTKVVEKAYNSKGNLEKTGEYKYTYNKNGQLTSEEYKPVKGVAEKSEYVFDSKGNMTAKKQYTDGKLSLEFDYDTAGNVTKIFSQDAEDMSTTCEYTYNKKGYLTKETDITAVVNKITTKVNGTVKEIKSTVEYKTVTEYDPDWVADANGNGIYPERKSQTYYEDETVNFVEEWKKETVAGTTVLKRYISTFDNASKKLVSVATGEAYTYKYDSKGNLSSCAFTDSCGGDWVYDYTFKNNSDGKITSQSISYNNEVISSITYKYDKNGNLISEVTSKNGKEVSSKTWTYKALKDIYTK